MLTRIAFPALLFALAACAAPEPEPPTPGPIGMANPASVHCEREGGRLDIRRDSDGGQYGVCVFADGRQCEEWALFRENRCVARPAR